MRRLLLVLTVCAVPAAMMAQSKTSGNSTRPIQTQFNGSEILPAASKTKVANKANDHVTEIGSTTYDLQTNQSMGRRIINHGDSTLSATWTISQEFGNSDAPFADRGTGYNYFDGSEWGPEPDERLEKGLRTGWPSISISSDGREVVVAHSPQSGQVTLGVLSNSAKGESDFSLKTPFKNNASNIWVRTAAVDSFLYVISNHTASDGDLTDSNGITSPMYYSRSINNGDTFAIDHIALPGYDSTNFSSGGGDGYSIDAKDSIVAISYTAGGTNFLALWLSKDYGINFELINVDSFPFPNLGAAQDTVQTDVDGDGATDTVLVADHTSVLIDNDGETHVFWTEYRLYNDGKDAGTPGSFIPFYNTEQIVGLKHWSTRDTSVQYIARMIDCDGGDGAITMGSAYNSEGNRYGNSYTLKTPQAGINDAGDIFVTYSALVERDTTTFDNSIVAGQQYSDVFVIYTEDNGATWSDQQNISASAGVEDVFPSIARDVDDNIHVLYMSDEEPGTILQGSDQASLMAMNYAKVSVADIKAGTLGNTNCPIATGIDTKALARALSQNYPNPANTISNIDLRLNETTNLELTLKNVLGQTVAVVANGVYAPGLHNFSISVDNLSNGVYFYSLTANGTSVAQKVIVGK
jgi:hypothetical protein